MARRENTYPCELISILKGLSGNAQEVIVLDKLLKAINHKLDTNIAIVRADRAKIERERAGDTARQHAGREFENTEGFTTPLPKAAGNAQKAYARARRDFEKNGGASALSLAITMMIARERRDETAAALKKYEAAEDRRRALGVHKEVEPFFDLMFEEGVEPRHLPYVRPETRAIICDLIRWDGHDPDMRDPDSPMPDVFGVYASRLVLKPGQFGSKARSTIGVPVLPKRYTDPQHYRFDELVPARGGEPRPSSGDDPATDAQAEMPAAVATRIIDGPSYPDESHAPELSGVVVRDDAAGSTGQPLTAEAAQMIAETVYSTNPHKLGIYWPKEGVDQGDYDSGRLIPALKRWVASDDNWPGAESFLAAARLGTAREFIAERRASGIKHFAKNLMDGEERAVADARAVGFCV